MTIRPARLRLERRGAHVLLATLDRPEVRNAFDTATAEALRALWPGLYVDAAGIRGVVLTGAGDRAFCAVSTPSSSRRS